MGVGGVGLAENKANSAPIELELELGLSLAKNSLFLAVQCVPYKLFPEGPIDLGGSRWVNFQTQSTKIGFDVYKKN